MEIQFLSGNGEVSGGEHMLLRMAGAAVRLGHDAVVVGPVWGGLAEACVALGLPYRDLRGTTRRAYALSLARYSVARQRGVLWANGGMAALAASGARAPLVVHLHQLPSDRQRHALGVARSRAAAVVVPSAWLAGMLPGSVPLVNWTGDLLLPWSTPSRPTAPRIGFVGRVSVDKGVDLLIEACSGLAERHPGVRLTIAGDQRFVPADQQKRIAEAIAHSAVPVDAIGWADPMTVFQRVDACVVPSRRPEAFGLVAAEAMSAGIPIAVSDAGALPEVVGSRHPWVFASGSRVGLEEALTCLLERADDTALHQARSRWDEEFSPAAGERRLGRLLASLAR